MRGFIALAILFWVLGLVGTIFCAFAFAENLTEILNGDTTFPTVWAVTFFGAFMLVGIANIANPTSTVTKS